MDIAAAYYCVEPCVRGLVYAIGRKVVIDFIGMDGSVKVVEVFEAEDTNSLEKQKAGWQAILDNCKKYTETV